MGAKILKESIADKLATGNIVISENKIQIRCLVIFLVLN